MSDAFKLLLLVALQCQVVLTVLLCRDVKEEEETTPWAEQQNWEGEQIRKANMRVGAKDKAKKEYDLVFEDQIDFIMDKVEVGDIEVGVPSALACE